MVNLQNASNKGKHHNHEKISYTQPKINTDLFAIAVLSIDSGTTNWLSLQHLGRHQFCFSGSDV
jgi:hypothetical protein